MTNIKDRVSFYESVKDSQSTRYCTLSSLLSCIKNGTYKNQIDIVRSQKTISQYKEEKRKLPMFTASGVFIHRNDDLANLQEYSNLIIADFDHFPDRQETVNFKNKLIQYATPLHLLSAFESPSGLGVKAVILHDNVNPNEHNRMFLQIKRDLFPQTPQFDMKCGNLSRTCFVSSDPNLFYNTDPSLKPYHFVPDLSISVQKPIQRALSNYVSGSTQRPFIHTTDQITLHNLFDMVERAGLGLKRDADSSLMDYLRKKWDRMFPNSYSDGNRHRSILARAKSFCEAGILVDAAIKHLVIKFGNNGIATGEIVNMVNYCYNTNVDSWGQYRSFLYELRLKGTQKRIQSLIDTNPFI